MRWRRLTQVVLLLAAGGLVVAGTVYDVFVYVRGGNEATVSRVILDAAHKYPVLLFGTGLFIGVLLGHWLWPQHVKEGDWP